MSFEKNGRVRITHHSESVGATWRVIGQEVEVTSKFGIFTVALGAMAASPSIVATEKLREVAMRAGSTPRPPADRARFNVRDA